MIKNFTVLIIAVFVMVVTGCAGKDLSPEESLALDNNTEKARIREYTIERETLIKAALTALNSIDSKYAVSQNPAGFYANRDYQARIEFKTTEKDNETVAEMKIWRLERPSGLSLSLGVGDVFGGPGRAAGSSIGITTAFGADGYTPPEYMDADNFIKNPEMYNYFYDRLDFVLGFTKDYYECGDKTHFTDKYVDNVLCAYGSSRVPQDANQPPGVIKYYNDLKAYNASIEKDGSMPGPKPEKPVRPW